MLLLAASAHKFLLHKLTAKWNQLKRCVALAAPLPDATELREKSHNLCETQMDGQRVMHSRRTVVATAATATVKDERLRYVASVWRAWKMHVFCQQDLIARLS